MASSRLNQDKKQFLNALERLDHLDDEEDDLELAFSSRPKPAPREEQESVNNRCQSRSSPPRKKRKKSLSLEPQISLPSLISSQSVPEFITISGDSQPGSHPPKLRRTKSERPLPRSKKSSTKNDIKLEPEEHRIFTGLVLCIFCRRRQCKNNG